MIYTEAAIIYLIIMSICMFGIGYCFGFHFGHAAGLSMEKLNHSLDHLLDEE
jgi:hypothetical protein